MQDKLAGHVKNNGPQTGDNADYQRQSEQPGLRSNPFPTKFQEFWQPPKRMRGDGLTILLSFFHVNAKLRKSESHENDVSSCT